MRALPSVTATTVLSVSKLMMGNRCDADHLVFLDSPHRTSAWRRGRTRPATIRGRRPRWRGDRGVGHEDQRGVPHGGRRRRAFRPRPTSGTRLTHLLTGILIRSPKVPEPASIACLPLVRITLVIMGVSVAVGANADGGTGRCGTAVPIYASPELFCRPAAIKHKRRTCHQ